MVTRTVACIMKANAIVIYNIGVVIYTLQILALQFTTMVSYNTTPASWQRSDYDATVVITTPSCVYTHGTYDPSVVIRRRTYIIQATELRSLKDVATELTRV